MWCLQISLWLSSSAFVSTFKNACDYMGLTWIMRIMSLILRQLMNNLNSIYSLNSPCHVTWHSYRFQGLGCGHLWWGLGEGILSPTKLAWDLHDLTWNKGGVEADRAELYLLLCWSWVAVSPFRQGMHAFSDIFIAHLASRHLSWRLYCVILIKCGYRPASEDCRLLTSAEQIAVE